MSASISLTNGGAAIVDEADLPLLSAHVWHGTGTARRYARCGAADNLLMHRMILAAPAGMVVDHINGNGLDNRRSNLRLCSPKENSRNRARPVSNSSGFKGVSFRESERRYRANIGVDGRLRALGSFASPIVAARAYDTAAIQHFGAFAALNFSAHRDWLLPHEAAGEWPPRLGDHAGDVEEAAGPLNLDLFEERR